MKEEVRKRINCKELFEDKMKKVVCGGLLIKCKKEGKKNLMHGMWRHYLSKLLQEQGKFLKISMVRSKI